MRYIHYLSFCFSVFFLPSVCRGGNFIENKGQWPEAVLFGVAIPDGMLFIEKAGVIYHQWDLSGMHHADPTFQPQPSDIRMAGHVWRMEFIGTKGSRFHTGVGLGSTKYHYFLGDDAQQWQGNCSSYSEVMQYGVFPGVDLHWYLHQGQVKMDWIIQPNGRLSDVQWRYLGVDGVNVQPQAIIINHSIGTEEEKIPYAFAQNQNQKSPLEVFYHQVNGICSFYSQFEKKGAEQWVIDPQLIFSTYSGSTSDNFGYTATYDDEGYLYSGSSAFGQGYPTTMGAYQVMWGGGEGTGTLPGTDIAITKYDVTGTSVVWSSFIGGDRDELPHSLVVDDEHRLLLYGSSGSFNFPTTSNALDTTFNGGVSFSPQGVGTTYTLGSDIVLVHFSSDGSALENATFWGGNGNDGVNTAAGLKFNYADEFRGEIDVAPNGNIVVTGTTMSADFPTTLANPNGGMQDAFVTVFDDQLTSVIFSRKLGGSDDESGCSVTFDSLNNIFVCGGTQSDDFQMTAACWQPQNNGGSSEGWIVKLNSNGVVIKSTYFGTAAYDQLYFIDTDEIGRPFVYGQSLSTGNAWIQNVSWSQPNSGMMVAALDADLASIIWSTTFGSGDGVPNLSPAAFLVDVCGQIYLSGWGGSVNQSANPQVGNTQDLWVSDNAFQNTTTGSDFYLLVIESDASAPVYGSYFGGGVSAEHVDGGTSRFDRKGVIYQSVCAGCGNHDDFPIYPSNAVSAINASSNCNNGVFKYDFELSLTYALAIFEDEICLGDSLYIQGQFQNASTLLWELNGEIIQQNNPSFWLTLPDTGWYFLNLIAIDSSTCNIVDSSGHAIHIRGPVVTIEPVTSMCAGDSILMGYPETWIGASFQWIPSVDLSADTLSQVVFNGDESNVYSLLVSHGVCTDTSFFEVVVNHVSIDLPPDTVVCNADQLDVSPLDYSPDASLIWSNSFDFTDVLSEDFFYSWNLGSFSTLYTEASYSGCYAVDSMHVLVLSLDQILGDDLSVCQGDTLWLGANTVMEMVQYEWNADDQIISSLDSSMVHVVANESEVFILTTSTALCSRSDTIALSISSLAQNEMNIIANPSSVYLGGEVQLSVTPAAEEINWEGNEIVGMTTTAETVLLPDQSQWVICELRDGECVVQDSVWIRVEEWLCGDESIFVPNAFSPNANGENDQLKIIGANGLALEWWIFDRWGNQVFYTQDANQGWDGTYSDHLMQSAVFHFVLKVKCDDGRFYQKEGNITLMR